MLVNDCFSLSDSDAFLSISWFYRKQLSKRVLFLGFIENSYPKEFYSLVLQKTVIQKSSIPWNKSYFKANHMHTNTYYMYIRLHVSRSYVSFLYERFCCVVLISGLQLTTCINEISKTLWHSLFDICKGSSLNKTTLQTGKIGRPHKLETSCIRRKLMILIVGQT